MKRFTGSNQLPLLLKESRKSYRLKRSLYGLKQSPRVSSRRFALIIQEFGLRKAQKDHFVFYKVHQKKRILMVVYVDDIVITEHDEKGIAALKSYSQ